VTDQDDPTTVRNEGTTFKIGLRSYACPAASRIKFVMMSGCEIRETWLAFTSIVFAPMRLAMKRWRSGLMVRSSVDTAYQLGFDRHAAWVVLPASSVRLKGA
jgi:hypothetical protein